MKARQKKKELLKAARYGVTADLRLDMRHRLLVTGGSMFLARGGHAKGIGSGLLRAAIRNPAAAYDSIVW